MTQAAIARQPSAMAIATLLNPQPEPMQIGFLLNPDNGTAPQPAPVPPVPPRVPTHPGAQAPVLLSAEYMSRLTNSPAGQVLRREFNDAPVVRTANGLMARFNALAAQPGAADGPNAPLRQADAQANVWAAQLPGYGLVMFAIDAQNQIQEIRRPPNPGAAAVDSMAQTMRLNAGYRTRTNAVRAEGSQRPQAPRGPEPAAQQAPHPGATQPLGASPDYVRRIKRAGGTQSSLRASFQSNVPTQQLVDGVIAAASQTAARPGAATGANPTVRQVHQGWNIWAFDIPNRQDQPNLLNRPFTALLRLDPVNGQVHDMRCGDQLDTALTQLTAAASRRR